MKRSALSVLMLARTMANLAGGSALAEEPKPAPKGGEPPPFLRRSSYRYGLSSPGRALTKAERKAKLVEQRRKQRRKRRK